MCPQLVLIRTHSREHGLTYLNAAKFWKVTLMGSGCWGFGQKYLLEVNSQGTRQGRNNLGARPPAFAPSSNDVLLQLSWLPFGTPSPGPESSDNSKLKCPLFFGSLDWIPSHSFSWTKVYYLVYIMTLGSSKEACLIWTGNLWAFQTDSITSPDLHEGLCFFYTSSVNHRARYGRSFKQTNKQKLFCKQYTEILEEKPVSWKEAHT